MKVIKWAGIVVGVLALLFGLAVLFTPPVEYETRVVVDRPVDVAWRVFADEDRTSEWLEGLKSIETISGQPQKAGSRFRLTFEEDGQEIVMEEEVLVWKDEEEFSFRLMHPMMNSDNTIRFTALGDDRTEIVSKTEVRGHPLFKPLLPLMKGAFVERNEQTYGRLKAIIEAEPEVSDTSLSKLVARPPGGE